MNKEEKKPKKPRGKKPVHPAFTTCRDIHRDWWLKNHPYAWEFNGREGRALNEILHKLTEAFKIAKEVAPTVDELIMSFRLVFEKYSDWGYWKGKCFRLSEINYRLINILEEIKKHNAANKSTSLADAAMDRFNSRQAI